MECKICHVPYDQSERRPRILPCGHSFCTACMKSLLLNRSLTCPNCRIQHEASEISQFPLIFELEEMMMQAKALISATKEKRPMKTLRSRKNVTKHRNTRLELVRQEQKISVRNLTSDCNDTLFQVKEHSEYLRGLDANHQSSIKELETCIMHHKKAQESLRAEDERTQCLIKKGFQQKEQMETRIKVLEEANTAEELGRAIEEADSGCDEGQEWIQECKDLLMNVKVVHDSSKIQTVAKVALQVMAQGMNSTLSVTEEDFTEDCSAIILAAIEVKMETLLKKNFLARNAIEAGQVLAVHRDKGHDRYAKITLGSGDIFCLHHLHEQSPPTHAHILPFLKVMAFVNISSALAFMDLSWPDSPPRRVYIRMNPKGEKTRVRQFVLMCTAELGPTYAITRLSEVCKRRQGREFVCGGDYDGEGGSVIVEELDEELLTCASGCGLVGSLGNDTRFKIFTKNKSKVSLTLLGQVTEGLDVVKLAVEKNEDITRVTVVDCGVVLEPQ